MILKFLMGQRRWIFLKYCSEQGCKSLIESGRYCERHKRRSRLSGTNNKSFYNSRAWKDLKAYCYERDKGRCQKCDKFVFGKEAQHHHKIPVRKRPDLRLNADNIITLCPKCHMLIEHNCHTKVKHNFNWQI